MTAKSRKYYGAQFLLILLHRIFTGILHENIYAQIYAIYNFLTKVFRANLLQRLMTGAELELPYYAIYLQQPLQKYKKKSVLRLMLL